MKHHNEHDISFKTSEFAYCPDPGNRGLADGWVHKNIFPGWKCPSPGGWLPDGCSVKWYKSVFRIPQNPELVYSVSFETRHPEGAKAFINGHAVKIKSGAQTHVPFTWLYPGKDNTFIVRLAGDVPRFYGVFSLYIQFDRVNAPLRNEIKGFRVLDLTGDIAMSDSTRIAGNPVYIYPEKQVFMADGIPFMKLPSKAVGPHQRFAVGVKAKAIYFLGNISSWDQGTIHILTELGDHRFEQFIGDHLGDIAIEYIDGARETIPLIYGVTLWWDKCWHDEAGGYVCQEPFLSNKRSRKILEECLLLRPVCPGTEAAFYFAYCPRNAVIKTIGLSTTGLRAGHPILSGITFTTGEAAKNILPVPECFVSKPVRRKLVDGRFFKKHLYRGKLELLKREVYTFRDTLPKLMKNCKAPVDREETQVDFYGSDAARFLTMEYHQNLFALKKQALPDGSFTFGHSAFGRLPGITAIGTWAQCGKDFPKSHGFNYNYPRDRGSTLMELACLGMPGRCAEHIKDMNKKLYLANPPHWLENGFIYKNRNRLIFKTLNGKKFNGLTESNGPNWVVLAYHAFWRRGGSPGFWASDCWKPFADAVDWNCWLMDNPVLPEQPKDIIPEGNELAGENGMIRYEIKGLLANQGLGKMAPFRVDCAYANIFAYYALLAGIRVAEDMGKKSTAERWNSYAERLKKAMLKHLVVKSPSGPVWHISMDSLGEHLYQSTRLGPLYLLADGFSYGLEGMAPELREISRNSYREHRRRWPGFCHCIHEMGYGTIYSALGAMMMDQTADYSAYIKDVAVHMIFKPQGTVADDGKTILETYAGVAHMRRGVHESGAYWKTLGISANIVHVSAMLRLIRLIKGIDDWSSRQITIMPRLPSFVKSMKIQRHPVVVGDVRGRRRELLDMTYACDGRKGRLAVSFTGILPCLSVRLGPFENTVKKVMVSIDKRMLHPAVCHEGDASWVWIKDLKNVEKIELKFKTEH